MIRAIVSGQRDPRALAALRDPRIQASEEETSSTACGQLERRRVIRIAASR
jgi:hypothetical protein